MLLKELQSLGLDVQVLKEDGTEAEIKEDIDYGESSIYKFAMANNFKDSGDTDRESLAKGGMSLQEFNAEGELHEAEASEDEEPDAESFEDMDIDNDDFTDAEE